MVDIKRQDITLQDRTKGISADEFAGGSYFYSEGIQTGYSTKGFKLGHYLEISNLNQRTTGYPVAIYATNGSMLSNTANLLFFTNDGCMEMKGSLNGSTSGEGGEAGGGAIFSEVSNSLSFNGGYVYGEYALGFHKTRVRKIKYKDTYNMQSQYVTNPRFENSAAGRTIGSGRTLTDDGMEHTTGNTAALSTSATPGNTFSYGRLAFKVTQCTAGKVTLSVEGVDLYSSETGRNGWFTGTYVQLESQAYTIALTPSSDFDGVIEAVNLYGYKDSSVDDINGLTSAEKHMAIERGGDIYITSGNTIDVLSTLDRTISKSVKLIKEDEDIVAITQQADSLIIWATDGLNSHQYYWNGVDTIASEVINWDGQQIQGVTATETVSYVLAGAGGVATGNAYRLYAVSGYQRSLIASNAYKVQGDQRNLNHYHPSKKFAFNDVDGSQSLTMYLDNLYLPGCDGIYQYGQTLPGLSKARSRPINYQNGSNHLVLYQDGSNLGFSYRLNQMSYYAIAYNDSYNYYGYLVTDSLYWDKLGTRKALEKIKLSYKSIPAEDGQINVYAIVDDDYFWRFDVTGVTNRPKIGDIYEVADDTTAEIIDIKKTSASNGVISFRTVTNGGSLAKAYNDLEKVTGNGDNTISTGGNYDNMIHIKTIATENQEYGADFIFGKDFVNNYIPYWHKIQFVIELVKNNTANNRKRTPEIYELSFISDITDVTL